MNRSQFWQLKSPVTQLSLESDSDDDSNKNGMSDFYNNEPKYSKSPNPKMIKMKGVKKIRQSSVRKSIRINVNEPEQEQDFTKMFQRVGRKMKSTKKKCLDSGQASPSPRSNRGTETK